MDMYKDMDDMHYSGDMDMHNDVDDMHHSGDMEMNESGALSNSGVGEASGSIGSWYDIMGGGAGIDVTDYYEYFTNNMAQSTMKDTTTTKTTEKATTVAENTRAPIDLALALVPKPARVNSAGMPKHSIFLTFMTTLIVLFAYFA